MTTTRWTLVAALLAVGAAACGNEANEQKIGGECSASEPCENEALQCLTQFKGGYCGEADCTADADCPEGSICVTHLNRNYCFLTCDDKQDCNENRASENESNCSSSIVRVGGGSEKACVPPSGS